MQQRTALIVASTITAFTLVVVRGVAARVTQPTVATSAPAPALASSATPDTSAQTAYLQQVDAYYQAREAAYQQQAAAYQQQASTYQQHESVYQQRDLAYQQLIRQANEQLQQAYHQMMAKKKRVPVQAQAQAPAVVQPTATPYAVSADGAAGIALAASPGANLLATPELVDFQGTVAYEVRLDRGNIYVDATTGKVLYNGAPVPVPHTSNASHPQNPPAGNNNTHSDDGNQGGGGGDD